MPPTTVQKRAASPASSLPPAKKRRKAPPMKKLELANDNPNYPQLSPFKTAPAISPLSTQRPLLLPHKSHANYNAMTLLEAKNFSPPPPLVLAKVPQKRHSFPSSQNEISQLPFAKCAAECAAFSLALKLSQPTSTESSFSKPVPAKTATAKVIEQLAVSKLPRSKQLAKACPPAKWITDNDITTIRADVTYSESTKHVVPTITVPINNDSEHDADTNLPDSTQPVSSTTAVPLDCYSEDEIKEIANGKVPVLKTEQLKVIHIWMKENRARSVLRASGTFSDLLPILGFTNPRFSEKVHLKLYTKIRDRIHREGVKLEAMGAIIVIDKKTSDESTHYVDWTDAWLEEGWNGCVEKPKGWAGVIAAKRECVEEEFRRPNAAAKVDRFDVEDAQEPVEAEHYDGGTAERYFVEEELCRPDKTAKVNRFNVKDAQEPVEASSYDDLEVSVSRTITKFDKARQRRFTYELEDFPTPQTVYNGGEDKQSSSILGNVEGYEEPLPEPERHFYAGLG